jgi:hypothetical protein
VDRVATDGGDTPSGTTPKGTSPTGTGFLLRESLVDGQLPSDVPGLRLTEESVIDATDAAEWQPREWHGVAFEVDLGAVDEGAAAEALRQALRPRWYLNFDTLATHYVIFSDRIFKALRSDAAALRSASEAAKDHARALGIPETQLDGC